jgi:hypothetical protein
MSLLMDSSQSADIQKVLNWYNNKFSGNTSIAEAQKKLYEDELMRNEAIRETGVKQNLNVNNHLLQSFDSKLTKIERSAADDIRAPGYAFNQLVDEMRNIYGYRVRLAILGDSEAQRDLNYYPAQGSKPEILFTAYKAKCEEYVNVRNQGNKKPWYDIL